MCKFHSVVAITPVFGTGNLGSIPNGTIVDKTFRYYQARSGTISGLSAIPKLDNAIS